MTSAIRRNISQVHIMVIRSLLHLTRNPESMIMTVFLPILVTLIFVYVFGGALGPNGDRMAYLRYVLPGILIMSPVFGAYMTGVGINNDMSKGIIDRFRTMAIHQSSILSGHICASIIRNLIGIVIVVIFSYIIGFRSDATLWHWLGALGLMIIYILMITMISLMIGLLGNTPESVSGMMMFIQFGPYISSAFIPTETMPKTLRYFAEYQPFTPVINTMRGLLIGSTVEDEWYKALIWCVGISSICFILSIHAYDRKNGF